MKNTILLTLILGSLTIMGQNEQTNLQQPGSFKGSITKSVSADYLLYLPEGYSEESRELWPMLVFLHGSGERGDDLELVKVHGPAKLIEHGRKFPFLVLSPQCPALEDFDTETLFALIDQIANDYNVDHDRIYVTGLSMGGAATWSLAMAHPDYFAAIAPVCGYVNRNYPSRASEIKHLPIWAFHGGNDDVVPLHREANMISALSELGSNVKFMIYPTENHDVWTKTYNNYELYEWLLKQNRSQHSK